MNEQEPSPRPLRQGLPRRAGGEPWPPAGAAPHRAAARPASTAATVDAATAVPPVLPQAGAANLGEPTVVSVAGPVAEPVVETVVESVAGPVADLRGTTLRRGLPRRQGGEPWPPAAAVQRSAATSETPTPGLLPLVSPSTARRAQTAQPAASPPAAVDGTSSIRPASVANVAGEAGGDRRPQVAETASSPSHTAAAPAAGEQTVRRGLPRVRGGEPWPAAAVVPAVRLTASAGTAAASEGAAAQGPDLAAAGSQGPAPVGEGLAHAVPAGAEERTLEPSPRDSAALSQRPPAADAIETDSSRSDSTDAAGSLSRSRPPLRSGLPRRAAASPASTAPSSEKAAASLAPEAAGANQQAEAGTETAALAAGQRASAPAVTPRVGIRGSSAGRQAAPAAPTQRSAQPASARPSAAVAGAGASAAGSVRAAVATALGREVAGRPLRQWLLRGGLVTIGLVALGLAAVFGARWLLATAPLQDFLVSYPGEYHLPEGTAVGFPAWVQWQHFFNVFLMVLIIRSGLQVRHEQRPSVFWTAKWGSAPKRKISLNLWLHQSLDLLWLVNGVVFVVLLFATGHWVRIVPTSWEVFPNAVSAALQYASLDWPTENGWVNYNSLQQLAYFTTVFIAAPLAAITGVRLSGLWPAKAVRLSRIYPVEVARAVHFPVMLYFVAFIIVHVALVVSTGALRNLNHMYGGQDVVNWTGFWILLASLGIIVGGWFAARPLVLAPIASLFGRVGR